MDVSLAETGLDDLVDALDIPERASQVLAGYGEADGPSRGFHADGSPRRVHLELLRRAVGAGRRRQPIECVPSRLGCWSVASTC